MQESIKKLYYCEPGKPLISGITAIVNDEDYGGFIFHAYGTDGKICMYVDHDGKGMDDWFGFDVEEEDGNNVCIDGDKNEDEIGNLTGVDPDFNEDIVTMNRTKGDDFLNKLCGEEEDGNDNNIDDDVGREDDANAVLSMLIASLQSQGGHGSSSRRFPTRRRLNGRSEEADIALVISIECRVSGGRH
ncbi:unnamed protein product [Lactuca virosa]|uniref:Uncharacterized protein n=1 Tax=Lactuca virosa TaxID=75947 RepID=A0AAU9MFH3_9ASTR|nr:unnamed protein product [Lactuca virosa]